MTVTVVVLYLLGVVTHYHSYSERGYYVWEDEDEQWWDEVIDRAIPVFWPLFAVAVLFAMLWEKYKDMRG